jgi:hypothetical protein
MINGLLSRNDMIDVLISMYGSVGQLPRVLVNIVVTYVVSPTIIAFNTTDYPQPSIVTASPSMPPVDSKHGDTDELLEFQRLTVNDQGTAHIALPAADSQWSLLSTLPSAIRTKLGPYYWSTIMHWATLVHHNIRRSAPGGPQVTATMMDRILDDARDGIYMKVYDNHDHGHWLRYIIATNQWSLARDTHLDHHQKSINTMIGMDHCLYHHLSNYRAPRFSQNRWAYIHVWWQSTSFR